MYNGGVIMNNKVYLNDIPLDLFLKYFTAEDLQDNLLQPALENDIRTFYKYNIEIGSINYVFFSEFDNIASLSELEEEIRSSFADIIENIETVTIDSIELDDEIEVQSYINNLSLYLFIGNYYLQKNDGTVNPYLYFGGTDYIFSDISDQITINNLKDYRNNSLIYSTVTGILTENYYTLFVGSVLVGYLRPNALKLIQKINNNGELLYLNEASEEVTESLKRSKFLAHNRALRKSVFLLNDPIEIIKLVFSQGKLGMFELGEENKKLVFYQNFEKKITYTKIEDFTSPLIYETQRISNSIKTNIENGDGEYSETVSIPIIEEFQRLLDLKRIKVTKTGSEFRSLNRSDDFQKDEYLIVDVVQRLIAFEGKTDIIIKNNDTVDLNSTNLQNLQIFKKDNGIRYLRLPINSVNEVEINSNPLNNLKSISNNFYQYKGVNYKKETESGNLRYPNGFISIPILIETRILNDESYIGQAKDDGEYSELLKYSPAIFPIPFDYSNFPDANEYTLNETTGKYEKISYIKDEINTKYIIEILEEVTPPSTTPDKSIIDDLLAPVSLKKFNQVFTDAGHIASDKYYESRGKLIPSDTVYNIKKNIILNMTTDYLSKNSEFFITKGIIYDKDNFWKMRIIAESFQKIMGSKKRRNVYLKEGQRIKFNDFYRFIFLSKEEPRLKNISIREYTEDNFTTERINTQGEINSINSFQKILEYKKLPYNQKRFESLYELKKRQTIFNDYDVSVLSSDFITLLERNFRDKTGSKEDFKNNLIFLYSRFFFESNTYSVKTPSYLTFYYKYFKDKVANLKERYFETDSSSVTYKSVLIKDQIKEDNDIILEKIFSKLDDWRVV